MPKILAIDLGASSSALPAFFVRKTFFYRREGFHAVSQCSAPSNDLFHLLA